METANFEILAHRRIDLSKAPPEAAEIVRAALGKLLPEGNPSEDESSEESPSEESPSEESPSEDTSSAKLTYDRAMEVFEETIESLREAQEIRRLREVQELTRRAEARGIRTSLPASEVLKQHAADDKRSRQDVEFAHERANRFFLSHEEQMQWLRELWGLEEPNDRSASEDTPSDDTSSAGTKHPSASLS